MNRRDFIATGLISGATAVAASNVALAGAGGAEPAHKFKLNYAPQFGMFKMNYRNIFKHIYGKGFKGVVGMEHVVKDNKTKEGEMACIQAYVSCDSFEIDGQ